MKKFTRWLKRLHQYSHAKSISELPISYVHAGRASAGEISKKFESNGYVVIRGALDPSYLVSLGTAIDEACLKPSFARRHMSQLYYMSNVEALPSTIRLVDCYEIISGVQSILGCEAKFIGHDSLSVGYSVPGLHDDCNSLRELGFELQPCDNPTVRCLFYVIPDDRVQCFGVVPNSHCRTPNSDVREFEHELRWLPLFSGDMILFHPRLLHSASPVREDKRMVVLTYGLETSWSEMEFRHGSEKRKQGVDRSSGLWSRIDENLKPSFIN